MEKSKWHKLLEGDQSWIGLNNSQNPYLIECARIITVYRKGLQKIANIPNDEFKNVRDIATETLAEVA